MMTPMVVAPVQHVARRYAFDCCATPASCRFCYKRCGWRGPESGLTCCGWASLATLLAVFGLMLLLPGCNFFTLCGVFGMNAVWLVPWAKKYRSVADHVDLDMLLKVFTFILIFGVLIAIAAEEILGLVAGYVLLPSDQDISRVTGEPFCGTGVDPVRCKGAKQQAATAEWFQNKTMIGMGYISTDANKSKTCHSLSPGSPGELDGKWKPAPDVDAPADLSGCPYVLLCSDADAAAWRNHSQSSGGYLDVGTIPEYCPGIVYKAQQSECPPSHPHFSPSGGLKGFSWAPSATGVDYGFGRTIFFAEANPPLFQLVHALKQPFCFRASPLNDAWQHNCSALAEYQRELAPNNNPSKLHFTLRIFLFLCFMGFLDAAMVEESVKLLSAKGGPVCPCNGCPWQSKVVYCPWLPCCVPGWVWTMGIGNQPGLRNPYSIIIFMVCAAAGFSTIENCEYLFLGVDASVKYPACYKPFHEYNPARLVNIAGRLLLAYPLHLLCGGLTGLQLVRKHHAGLKWWCVRIYNP